MSTRYYVLTERERRKKMFLKEYLEKIEKALPKTLLEWVPNELRDYIADVELDDAVKNTSHLLVSAMDTYFGGEDERELCTVSGTTHLRRFQPIPVIADDLIVEDEYGKVYCLDEFEKHMKESYPALSRTEVEGMVRMMKRWEEQYRPS